LLKPEKKLHSYPYVPASIKRNQDTQPATGEGKLLQFHLVWARERREKRELSEERGKRVSKRKKGEGLLVEKEACGKKVFGGLKPPPYPG